MIFGFTTDDAPALVGITVTGRRRIGSPVPPVGPAVPGPGAGERRTARDRVAAGLRCSIASIASSTAVLPTRDPPSSDGPRSSYEFCQRHEAKPEEPALARFAFWLQTGS